MFVPARRATLLFRASAGDMHLHICLTDPINRPSEPPQQVLLVSATTVYGYSTEDHTCILRPGDHDFFRSESYVAYSKWRCDTVRTLQHAVAQRLAIDKGPLREDVFARLKAGFSNNPRVAKYAKEFVAFADKLIRP